MSHILLVISAIIVLLSRPVDASAEELLENGSFEGDWYDVSATQQCPEHWHLHWTEGEPMGDAENLSARPESRVLPKSQVPPREHDLYFRDGKHVVKIFWSDEPIHTALAQDVNDLERGRRYRFTVPAYVDTFEWNEEEHKKEKPSDPYAAQVRLGAGPKRANWQDGSIVSYSAWRDAGNKSPFYLAPITLQFEFVATASEMTVFVEYRSKWGLDNSGIFLDALRLEPLGMAWTPTPTRLSPSSDLATATPSLEKQATATRSGGYGRQTATRTTPSPSPSKQVTKTATPTAGKQATKTSTLSPATSSLASAMPPTATPEPASVCVLVYHDQDNDGHRDSGEKVLPEVVLTLTSDGDTIERRITDNASECFVGLPPGAYKLFQTPPPGYEGTSRRKIKLYAGTQLNVQFANAHEGDKGVSSAFPPGTETKIQNSKGKRYILAPTGTALLGGSVVAILIAVGIALRSVLH